VRVIFAAAAMAAMPAAAAAQATSGGAQPAPAAVQPAAAAPSRHPVELAVGGFTFGETSFGSIDAQLIGSNGSPVTLFRADSALRPGFGFDAHLGIGLSPAVAIEGSGSWTRADFRTRVTDDLEGVGETVVKERLTRYAVEGAVLWMFARGTRTAWFVRGSAGWMRDLTGNDSLVEDGLAGSVGGGMKYLWNTRGGFRVAGFRVEGRALLHKRGLVLGPDREKLRVTPAAAGSLIIGF
jgi:hypothetical protein